MANRFYQIDLRLARARKHLTELQSLADEFASTTMKSVTFKQNDYREPFYTSAEEFEVLGEVEAGELQVIIDDFVQNLRAALNYLITVLARFDSPQTKVGRSLQFPVEGSADRFWKHRPRYLRGLSSEHVAMIERVQPYNRFDWTDFLKRLSNRGKHVELVKVINVGRMVPPSLEEQAEWYSQAISVTADVDVISEVAFEEDGPVVDTLHTLHAQIANFVEQFRARLG